MVANEGHPRVFGIDRPRRQTSREWLLRRARVPMATPAADKSAPRQVPGCTVRRNSSRAIRERLYVPALAM